MIDKVTVEGMFQFGDWSEEDVCRFAIQNISEDCTTTFKCVAYGEVAEKLQGQFLSSCKLVVTGRLGKRNWNIAGFKSEEVVVIVADKVEVIRMGDK